MGFEAQNVCVSREAGSKLLLCCAQYRHLYVYWTRNWGWISLPDETKNLWLRHQVDNSSTTVQVLFFRQCGRSLKSVCHISPLLKSSHIKLFPWCSGTGSVVLSRHRGVQNSTEVHLLSRACYIQYGFPRTFPVLTCKLHVAQLTAIDRVGQLWLVVGNQQAEATEKK
jgi:hypothetical protein